MNYERYKGAHGAWKTKDGTWHTGTITSIGERFAYIKGSLGEASIHTEDLCIVTPVTELAKDEAELAHWRDYVELQRKVETLTKQRDALAEQARIRLYARNEF